MTASLRWAPGRRCSRFAHLFLSDRSTISGHPGRTTPRARSFSPLFTSARGLGRSLPAYCAHSVRPRAPSARLKPVLGRLFLLFTIVPVLELWLLISVGGWLGTLPTVALVVLTGLAGAAL
ncbi:MAG: FxsA family protein, partial [Myxococcota bacterium]